MMPAREVYPIYRFYSDYQRQYIYYAFSAGEAFDFVQRWNREATDNGAYLAPAIEVSPAVELPAFTPGFFYAGESFNPYLSEVTDAGS